MNILDMRRISNNTVSLVMVGVALLLALQPVVTGLHHSHADHHWCPEHRTLEHGSSLRHSEGSPWAFARDALRASAAGDGQSAHAQCPCQQLLSERFHAADGEVAIALCSPAHCEAGDGFGAVTPAQISRLALAPKLSPPA